jgi:NAD+ kinase
MKTVGILYNPRVAQAHPLAKEMAAWIEQRGRRAQVCISGDAPGTLCWEETDLLVTLGGDGSILKAARAAAAYGTPILGVNLGRVGFLTEACPETWRDVLSRALVGDYWIEERMMLRAVARRGEEALGQADALNGAGQRGVLARRG